MNIVEYIMSNFDIHTLLQRYGITQYTETNEFIRCKCPIHEGQNNTAFVYNTSNNLWYCHTKCNQGGSLIDLVATKEDVSFSEAINLLKKWMEIPDTMVFTSSVNINVENQKWIEEQKNKYNVLNEFDMSSLNQLYDVNKYRNFTDILKTYGIKFSKQLQRIVVPIEFNHKVVAVTMRTVKKNTIKWMHQPSGFLFGNILFNYDNIIPNESVYVVEGVWDALNLIQNGITNVVATFGAHLTKKQANLLMLITCDVIMLFDNDKAGITGTHNAIKMLKNKTNLKVALLPDNKDPGELTQEEIQTLKIKTVTRWLNDNTKT